MKALVISGLLFASAASPTFAQAFGGYECTEDCSGHKAGYEWAEENAISDDNDCSGNSASFSEGCQAYVEDPDRGSETDDDGNYLE
ncbi:hypothetical protein [Sinorhizobium meliloti]|uniref:hypothetical protein n=1 Tax=Rhizobium meliloti TaxID=382 RepID=UPI000FD8F9C0|nr:hypothetical protein [Sinorhizobium meliloti]RVO57770.1 hypothetical protein CN092_11915 [Sinorhizobium meliloti]